jgi:hypothetical protein
MIRSCELLDRGESPAEVVRLLRITGVGLPLSPDNERDPGDVYTNINIITIDIFKMLKEIERKVRARHARTGR